MNYTVYMIKKLSISVAGDLRGMIKKLSISVAFDLREMNYTI